MEVAKSENAIPFDAPGAELFHYEENGKEYVSFDSKEQFSSGGSSIFFRNCSNYFPSQYVMYPGITSLRVPV